MADKNDLFDVIVIGAGPVGLNAAARAVRGGLTAAVVEDRLARVHRAAGQHDRAHRGPGTRRRLETIGLHPDGPIEVDASAVNAEVPLDRLWHAVPPFPTVSETWLRLLEQYGL